MFEESLVESTTILRSRNRWPVVISTAFYASLALALVSLPMLHPEIVSLHTPSLVFFTPPRPTPPPIPPERVHITATSSSASSAPSIPIINSPHPTPTISTTPEEAPNFNPTSIMTGGNSSPFGSSITTGTPSIHVVPASSGTNAPHHGPLNISTGVSAGLLLTPLHPTYPPIAIAAHREGTVIVQAIISKAGHIESAHVISGPAMLQAAALEAVRNARYRPFLLNNQPTEVDTTFSINFRLGGGGI